MKLGPIHFNAQPRRGQKQQRGEQQWQGQQGRRQQQYESITKPNWHMQTAHRLFHLYDYRSDPKPTFRLNSMRHVRHSQILSHTHTLTDRQIYTDTST